MEKGKYRFTALKNSPRVCLGQNMGRQEWGGWPPFHSNSVPLQVPLLQLVSFFSERCDSGYFPGQSQSCQAVGLKSGQAGGAQSWCSQGKQDIRGLFSAETGKFSPSCCLPEVTSIESEAYGWDCRRALWSGS